VRALSGSFRSRTSVVRIVDIAFEADTDGRWAIVETSSPPEYFSDRKAAIAKALRLSIQAAASGKVLLICIQGPDETWRLFDHTMTPVHFS
jgi:hypothetical protein